NPALYPHLAYDPVKDFTPIAGLVSIYHALALNSSVPADSVKELITLGKAGPGQLNYGDYGVGSSGHLNMEMFKAVTGVNFVAVHYKGATPALEDVMAGHIQLMFVSAGTAMPQAKAGTVKIIGLGAEKRMALLPDVPTIAETVPGFTAVSWFGLFGPAGVPPDIVDKINAEVRAVFADPKVQHDFLDAQYFESLAASPAALSERIRAKSRNGASSSEIRISAWSNFPTITLLRVIAGLDPAIYADAPIENAYRVCTACQHGYAGLARVLRIKILGITLEEHFTTALLLDSAS